MNLEQIVDEIQLAVQDTSLTGNDDGELTERINAAVQFACSQPGIEIPTLKAMGSFTTVVDQAYAEVAGLDAGFTGRIIRAGKPETKIYTGLEDLYDDYYPLDKEGDIEAVCIQGNVIWYQGIPETAEEHLCILQSDPPLLDDDDDVPTVIPEFLHMDVIVHGVIARLYNLLEDGIDGEKVNTINSLMYRKDGIQKFREWLGSRRQHVKSSVWRH